MGRRAKSRAVSKTDLLHAVSELRQHGIGVSTIADLLGYGRGYLYTLGTDCGIEMTGGGIRRLDGVPDSVLALAETIRETGAVDGTTGGGE